METEENQRLRIEESEEKPALTEDSESCRTDHVIEREVWSRKAEYILSLIGYSVGLSNIWRFPYLCVRNGGGAFLIPFFFFLIFCGIPLFFLEVCLGQFSGKSALVAWSSVSPLFKGLGYLMMILSGIVCWYNNLLMAWVIYYLVHAFYPHIPWGTCDNWWNTDKCIVSRSHHRYRPTEPSVFENSTITEYNKSENGEERLLYFRETNTTIATNITMHYQTAAFEFWQYNLLRKSRGIEEIGNIQWHLVVCLLVGWIIIGICLIKGVKSVGKVVYVTALLPYILLTIFLIRGLTLEGSVDGIIFYLKPDFTRLLTLQIWLEAAVQVFFSLGPCWGGLITMSSYNKFKNQCLKDAIFTALADGLTSFYAGFVVFAILGFMANDAGLTMKEVSESGPGLVFVAYPEAIMKLPIPHIWAVMFFLMLLTLGIDSQFGLFETVSSGLVDMFPVQLNDKKMRVVLILSVLLFVTGLPFTTNGGAYLFQLIDWYASAFCIVFGSLFECYVIAWIYGAERFNQDIMLMLGRPVPVLIRWCLCVITPAILLFVLVCTLAGYKPPNTEEYTYPDVAVAFGTCLAIIPLLPTPLMAMYVFWSAKGETFVQKLQNSTKPAADWGPSDHRYRDIYVPYKNKNGLLTNIYINFMGDKNQKYRIKSCEKNYSPGVVVG